MFVLGYVLQCLIDRFGWRITMGAQAGIILLGVPFGLLLRPLQNVTKPNDTKLQNVTKRNDTKLQNVTKPNDTSSDNEQNALSRNKLQKGIDNRTRSYSESWVLPSEEENEKVETQTPLISNLNFLMFCFIEACFHACTYVTYTFTPDRAVKQYQIEPSSAAVRVVPRI